MHQATRAENVVLFPGRQAEDLGRYGKPAPEPQWPSGWWILPATALGLIEVGFLLHWITA